VWRRLEVPADLTLAQLHWILQDTMGWTDSHMHQFVVGRQRYGRPVRDVGDDDTIGENGVRLADVARAKAKFVYEYDFGDSWEHEILVERVGPPEPGATYPRCTGGARACPPEDCGGFMGYAGFLEAIANPRHRDHEDMVEWIGGSFDPEAFDLEAVNRSLRPRRSGKRPRKG